MSDAGETPESQEPSIVYVFGNLRREKRAKSTQCPTLVVARRTCDGWCVRSTDRSYNHDYVCYESFEDVMEWLDADLSRPFLCRDRDEVLSILTNSEITTGFLLPGDCSSQLEAVDKALRHLESAWGAVPQCCTPESPA